MSSLPTTGVVPEPRPAPDGPVDIRRVAVVGLGYVGLPTSLALHAAGLEVIGIDIDPARLDDLRDGRVDAADSDRRRLAAALADPAHYALGTDVRAVENADAVLVCVPTPVDEHQAPDLRALRRACADVAGRVRRGQLVILTSTSYVGTTRDLLAAPLRRRGLVPGVDVHVAFSPERVDPGNVRFPQDAVPRVVGGLSHGCSRRAATLLARICPVVHEVSSTEAAEMTKLLENTFRAVNIALANEVSDACRELDLDVMEIIGAAATKPYGFMPFYPGPGVGGHCIPCDPHYLLWQMRRRRVRLPLMAEAMEGIAVRPVRVVARVAEVLAGGGRPVAGSAVLVVGVTYKPGVADLRESPALEIMDRLAASGAHVSYVDPYVPALPEPHVAGVDRVTDPAAGDWDLVLVHTLHPAADHTWLSTRDRVLDATYRLDSVPHRVLL